LNSVNQKLNRSFQRKTYGQDNEFGQSSGTGYSDDYIDDYGDNDFGGNENDNYRWELFMEDVLDRFEHSLCGEKLNSTSGKWFTPKGAKPKLNELGINDIISDFSLLMNKSTYLANIKPDYADEETKVETGAFINKLKRNFYIWKVDESQYESIIYQYARTLKLALSRPVGDLERRHRNKRFNKWGNQSMPNKGNDEILV